MLDNIRSFFFNILYIFGSLFWSIALLWALPLGRKRCTAIISTVYGGYIRLIEKTVMGLHLRMEGLENLPEGTPYILAAKHQSAYETLKLPFMKRLGYPVIILKKELTRLPLWGLYPRAMGLIAIDRSQGAQSLRAMTEGCRQALADGRPILIFPQGTRVAPGVSAPYKGGLAKLYKDLKVPVVPLALNTGVFWGKNAFFKKSGTITFRFLPALPADMPPLKMIEALEKAIESESDALLSNRNP